MRKPRGTPRTQADIKEASTINFEKLILDRIREKARKERRTTSWIVNHLLKQIVMGDVEYYTEMARLANMEMQNYIYLKETALALREREQLAREAEAQMVKRLEVSDDG